EAFNRSQGREVAVAANNCRLVPDKNSMSVNERLFGFSLSLSLFEQRWHLPQNKRASDSKNGSRMRGPARPSAELTLRGHGLEDGSVWSLVHMPAWRALKHRLWVCVGL